MALSGINIYQNILIVRKSYILLYEILTVMEILELEKEIIEIIQEVCIHQEVEEVVSGNFYPGNFIMSQVLVSIFSQIEIKTGITIPNDCYIFHDQKTKKQLNIKEAATKLLKLSKNEQ